MDCHTKWKITVTQLSLSDRSFRAKTTTPRVGESFPPTELGIKFHVSFTQVVVESVPSLL